MRSMVRRFLVSSAAFSLFLLVGVAPSVQAISQSALDSINNHTPFFDPNDTGGSCGGGTTTLAGSDNEQKAYNYFRSNGLNDMQAAAVVGNLMLESSMIPNVMEKGGTSNNPADADPLGWGIAQWTPGSKIINIAQSLSITGPIYALPTQLDIVWAEMTGTAPTGYQNVAGGLKQQASLADAVRFFQTKFESGTNFDDRLSYAQEALQKYGGSPTTSTDNSGGSSGCGPSSVLSPDCQAASGVAKIICAAKQYDPVSYSETYLAGHQGGAAWHASCPIIGPDCILDCSGLVNIAVYDAYGTDLREVTTSEAADSQYWKPISFAQLQAGDLIQPNPGHVEIVDHIQGSTIYTFGAHSAHRPQPDQVGPAQYQDTSGNLYLHYVGPGAS